MDNQFGKISRIHICAAQKEGRTILEDIAFTAPYKIMSPFQKENGGIQIMPLCASAGIMRGDSQEFSYCVREGADLEVLSQSFEKIHRMEGGSAARKIQVQVEKGGTLYYYPQPVIPFAGSAFDSDMEIHLEEESSRLFLLEIISCGRIACEERFAYRRFTSKVRIYRAEKLIYRDNARYEPEKMPMDGIGMYEGYTHMANIFLTMADNPGLIPDLTESIWQILEESAHKGGRNETRSQDDADTDVKGNDAQVCDGGVTRLTGGDLAVRIFGFRAQTLQQIAEKIKNLYEQISRT